jgi:hypothetical protein
MMRKHPKKRKKTVNPPELISSETRSHRKTIIPKKEMGKVSKSLLGGPAGWHCKCCNPYKCHPRKMKPLARRLYRRVSKQNFEKDWN